MLTTTLEKSTTWDVDHRLQSASIVFNANRWILCDSRIAISKRLEYFDCVISPVARYAAGHRSIYKQDLHRFDVLQRRLLRSVVGPPRNVDWTQPWHEIFNQWNGRIQSFMGQLKCKPWSEIAYNTIGIWPIILHCCQTTGGSSGFCIGTLVGGDGLDARKILGTASLETFAA